MHICLYPYLHVIFNTHQRLCMGKIQRFLILEYENKNTQQIAEEECLSPSPHGVDYILCKSLNFTLHVNGFLSFVASQVPLPLGLDCGALTSARPPLPPRPPAMASRIGLRMQVRNAYFPLTSVLCTEGFYQVFTSCLSCTSNRCHRGQCHMQGRWWCARSSKTALSTETFGNAI